MKNGNLPKVAYFCMEFGLNENFNIYSGGLGILAGDILKAAKDEGYPIVGVGILWRQGYTKQVIDENGRPCDCYPEYVYDFLKDTNVTVKVKIRGRDVAAKVWLCDCFENNPLYLLDTNIPGNPDRLITGQLYGWFDEERVAQEMILGIGGVRALKKLGIDVDIYHFNDSHPILAGIELIRERMEQGMPFEKAWEETRKQIVFTTHTPVEAGNEVHSFELLEYMGAFNGLTGEQMARIGGKPFSMTVAGLRLSKKANAVSQLHGQTAKRMWKGVDNSSEIIAITNGVHNGTWQDRRIADGYNGSNLWELHMQAKREMIEEIYKRNGIRLKEDVLTIGFARRFAPYKRSNLIFTDRKMIEPVLKEGKLQLIFSGKAHPNDLTGKKIVEELYKMTKLYPESVVFLQNYDMKIGKMLTRGCDVWLNNPIRPMEASGTSGMKAAMNGVLNLSILDGWWPEFCIHGVNGWQIGDGYEGEDCDINDAKSLYKVLFEEVMPTYYENRKKWLEMMRESIRMSTENFSARRMLRDYYSLMYEPEVSDLAAAAKE
ncbi:putative alpha-glucan phosphorylase [Thermoclostridium stercorarium subsp. stercorarium DSM 8532]|jgi:starch phosphorylase|uniref:glycogen phosphorylase n=3 Tax=Thermoclostridium stercorarium TaxID=1510 RepID=L7VMK1_THES1|nr:alpha-glucan family phosphorylase [Thermoclostridium stercorarium]AGC67977.1 putative alpha-glucan phosphorylase [Thermoclostridium stercorarium subsp. stercorarium DSM 8532]AGI39012.1 alpha-glucan phosphorylase [Thermoclostridium stercorarium subsp. stercorarium DSM 8532]ANW98379.1 alpha-glucan phosphorylase [Thermoclostridium stercorarium subsp. thermolacticum DSM 2910]ANX00915.1 alpha-glucan phosphorylase [Thermoclostridium stercorarium subsp. leptospartum DSM 9219]UZQ86520.1 alpha-gluca